MLQTINDDFDLQKIADSGQCFRWEKMDEDTYRIINGTHCIYVTAVKEGSKKENGRCERGINRRKIGIEADRNERELSRSGDRTSGCGDKANRCEFEFDCSKAVFDSVWHSYFDLDERYETIRRRIDPAKDPFLWEAAEHEKGIRILRQDPWEMLITFLISQNKNIPAIRRSVELLCESCGERMTDVRGLFFYAFPTPEAVAALSEERLKGCSLGYRWKYVKAAAEAVLDKKINLNDLRDSDEEMTISGLTKLYGVGLKVANCISLFGFHHINAFPKDVWVNRILAEKYADGYPFEEYSPYNGIYQQYMFSYYRNRENVTIQSRFCE